MARREGKRLEALAVKYYGMLGSPLTWFAFVFGALIGSFLNVCIIRIPQGIFWKYPRSRCPHCGAPVPAYLNLPILSYFLLRGRTACCSSRLSIQYPLVELLTAIMFAILYWNFPFVSLTDGGMSYSPAEFLRFAHAAVFTSLLIVCSVIDLKLMIIPDVISLPMILATPLVVYLHPELSWQSGLIGVIAGAALIYGIAWTYYLIRGDVGMGFGDVKLLAAIGGWLGYEAILPTIFYGSVLGALLGLGLMAVSRRHGMATHMPFGPYLSIGALLHLLLGTEIRQLLLI